MVVVAAVVTEEDDEVVVEPALEVIASTAPVIDEFVKSDIHKYIDSGIFGDTLIELEDGNSVKIKDIHVNDILKFGERVLGIVKIEARDIKLFKHTIDDNVIKGAGNLQIFKTDLGIGRYPYLSP